MPIAEIAGERSGQEPINRTCAAIQRFLCRPDQDKSQTLLDHLEVGPQIDGATSSLSHDRHLRSTVEKQAPGVDGSIGTESEADFASQFARDIGLHALRGIRTEADGGDDVEAACLACLREDACASVRDKASNCCGSIGEHPPEPRETRQLGAARQSGRSPSSVVMQIGRSIPSGVLTVNRADGVTGAPARAMHERFLVAEQQTEQIGHRRLP